MSIAVGQPSRGVSSTRGGVSIVRPPETTRRPHAQNGPDGSQRLIIPGRGLVIPGSAANDTAKRGRTRKAPDAAAASEGMSRAAWLRRAAEAALQ